ncbi:pinensin family lanthipeptide [Roseivirga sp. BDSF3-8]
MKKLSLEELTVSSFTTSDKETVKGGYVSEYRVCPATVQLISCYRAC